MAKPEQVDEWTRELVRASRRMVNYFRMGHNPTELVIGSVERALRPFTTDKICGHSMIEECECTTEDCEKSHA